MLHCGNGKIPPDPVNIMSANRKNKSDGTVTLSIYYMTRSSEPFAEKVKFVEIIHLIL